MFRKSPIRSRRGPVGLRGAFMDIGKLKPGRVYESEFKGPYSRCPVTFLGKVASSSGTRYYFYDGVCEYDNVDRVPDRASERMNIMHLTENDVHRYIM